MPTRANVADFALTLDGQDLTPRVRPRLVGLTLTEKRGGEADQLDLVLDDSDGKLALPRKGAAIRLSLGWAGGADVAPGLVDKGSFVVDDVEWAEAPDQVTVRARSADLTAAFRTRREKGWTDTTLGAVARDVAAANRLRAAVAPELASVRVHVLAQHQRSDMALLRRLGREHDAVATVKDGRLILSPIGRGTAPGGKPLPGVTIRRGEGSGARYREVERSGEAGYEARWHDAATAKRHTVTVGGGSGAGKPHRVGRVFHNEADARAAATAASNRARRAAAEFEYSLALGRADLYPERPVTLAGFKRQADARRWILAEVTHALDGQGGFVTRVKLETR